MKSIIDKLSDSPEGRSFLKWLTVGLGIWTGSEATQGSYTALVTGLLAVLVKWLEQHSSNAAREKLEQPVNEPSDSEPLSGPDFSQIWSKQAPSEDIKIARTAPPIDFEAIGIKPMPAIPATFPTPDEIKLTEEILEASEPITTVLWDDPDEGQKSRKFSRRYDAVVFKRTKPGARIAI